MITEGHNFLNNEDDFFTINKDIILLPLVNKNAKTILEVGCGKGTFLQKLFERGFICEGIDFKNVINDARKICNLEINFYEGDFNSKEFNKKYDCIIASGVIEHIKEDVFFVKRMCDLLNDNGQVIILTSAHPILYSVFDKKVHHHRRYSKKKLIGLFEDLNFKINFCRYWNILSLPYLMYAKFFNKLLLSDKKLNGRYFNKIINIWFKILENRISIPLGVDLIIVAEKK